MAQLDRTQETVKNRFNFVTMTAKEYLGQYKAAQQHADKLRERYEYLLEQATAPASNVYQADRIQATRQNYREKQLEDLRDARDKWQFAALDAIETRQDIFGTICDIQGAEGDILIERYLNCLTWHQVSDAVGLSYRRTHTLHLQALEIVQTRIDNMTTD